jgi:hypothetical protein
LLGILVKRIHVALPTEQVSAADRQALRTFADELQGEPEFPAHKGYWCGLYFDDEGKTWLQIPEAGKRVFHDENHVYHYRVLSKQGEYLGDTSAPGSLMALGIGSEVNGDSYMALVLDEDTYEKVPTIYHFRSTTSGSTIRK